jgi:mannitol-1-phosphate 5-dehydrogenase
LVNNLRKKGKFDIHVLGNENANCTIQPEKVYQLNDAGWYDQMPSAGILFCSVFGSNFRTLAKELARGLERRYKANPGQELNLITCENFMDAASILRTMVLQCLEDEVKGWLAQKIGFSESMVLRTCLGPEEWQDPLAIRVQNYFELPCDREAMKGTIPDICGLKPLENFQNQLRRKIFTYNCINAVITYLGARKDYTYLSEAGRDPDIVVMARQAAVESSDAQIAAFGFDREEQYEWVEAALTKFADIHIPDPISRNGADPARKLGREDRLIGPALLATKHHIKPEGLMEGILAAFEFQDEKSGTRIADRITAEGIEAVLEDICSLVPAEPLYDMLRKEYHVRWP